jgi:hypothetical protein
MRPGQTRRPHGRNNGNNPYHNRQQMPHRSRNFESNGPNVKIRGTPHQIFERYVALAREASTSGDRVAAENLYQQAVGRGAACWGAVESDFRGKPKIPRTSSVPRASAILR